MTELAERARQGDTKARKQSFYKVARSMLGRAEKESGEHAPKHNVWGRVFAHCSIILCSDIIIIRKKMRYTNKNVYIQK